LELFVVGTPKDPGTDLIHVGEREANRRILYEKGIKLKLSGNEVYYTNSLLVKDMLSVANLEDLSKIHCQKVLI